MPLIETIPKKRVEAEYETIRELQEKCESCKVFKGETPNNIFIYSVYPDYRTEDGPAMVAVAQYGKTYAIHPPKYLAGKQWTVLEFLQRDIESDEKIVVFSTKVFANLKKYSYGRKINVKLCV